jgi:hypothetical protein
VAGFLKTTNKAGESIMLMEHNQEILTIFHSQPNHLEQAILELYQCFCPIYGTIDFAQVALAPYSTHSVPIPHTKLNVMLVTPSSAGMIGTPSYTAGPLQWKNELKIEFPSHTTFVSISYGGGPGEVRWGNLAGVLQPVPMLSAMIAPDPMGHFYLVQHEGISSLHIVSTGTMFLNTLAVGVSAHA